MLRCKIFSETCQPHRSNAAIPVSHISFGDAENFKFSRIRNSVAGHGFLPPSQNVSGWMRSQKNWESVRWQRMAEDMNEKVNMSARAHKVPKRGYLTHYISVISSSWLALVFILVHRSHDITNNLGFNCSLLIPIAFVFTVSPIMSQYIPWFLFYLEKFQ